MTTATAAWVREEVVAPLEALDEAMQRQACELTLVDFGEDAVCGDDSAEVFQTFARSMEERRRDLVIAWLDRDLEGVARAAHAVRVAARGFGLHAAAALARRVERSVARRVPHDQLLARLAALLLVIDPAVVLSHKPGPRAWTGRTRPE